MHNKRHQHKVKITYMLGLPDCTNLRVYMDSYVKFALLKNSEDGKCAQSLDVHMYKHSFQTGRIKISVVVRINYPV